LKWGLQSVAVAGFAVSLLSAQNAPTVATPGTVNYIEGQVSVNGSDLMSSRASGPAILQTGQSLTTRDGKAEVLLSPGVFLRVGRNSEVWMVTPDSVDPRVELARGEAMVEVDQKLNNGRVNVITRAAAPGSGAASVDATILKSGLYRFDSDKGLIEVLDGKLSVPENGKSKEIGKGKEFVLNGSAVPTVGTFDPKAKAEDELYLWSRMRSGYMAEVTASTARYVYSGYAPFAGAGWYWSPYFASWSWLPGDGYFNGPFGYPFFSPSYVIYAPFYRGVGAYRGGIYAGGFAARSSGVAAFRGGAAFHGGGGRR
jgi:hypothetical protein